MNPTRLFLHCLFVPPAEQRAARAIAKALTVGDVLPTDGRPMTPRELLRSPRLAIAEEHNAIALYQAIVDVAGIRGLDAGDVGAKELADFNAGALKGSRNCTK